VSRLEERPDHSEEEREANLKETSVDTAVLFDVGAAVDNAEGDTVAGPIPGLTLGRLPADVIRTALEETSRIHHLALRHQHGENIQYHLNLPFPINFPTGPVFPLGSPRSVAVERLARCLVEKFGLNEVEPYRSMGTMHGIVRIYDGDCSIGWHKDLKYFEECVLGVVLENTLPEGRGLRWRPDHLSLF